MRLAHHFSYCYSTDAFAGVHSRFTNVPFRPFLCLILERVLACLGFDLMHGIRINETCFGKGCHARSQMGNFLRLI